MAVTTRSNAAVEELSVSAYTVPTDTPESDGTLEWDSTTLVLVEVRAGDETGLGYTYGPRAVAALIDTELRQIVDAADAFAPAYTYVHMCRSLRNAGHPGIAMLAVSALDIALWDLKARLLDLPLADILPRTHETVPVYGSGGFTSYSLERLREQLGGWVARGHPAREDEARSRAGPRSGASRRCARGDRGRRRAVRRRERRVLPEASARLGAPLCGRLGSDVVRGAGELR